MPFGSRFFLSVNRPCSSRRVWPTFIRGNSCNSWAVLSRLSRVSRATCFAGETNAAWVESQGEAEQIAPNPRVAGHSQIK